MSLCFGGKPGSHVFDHLSIRAAAIALLLHDNIILLPEGRGRVAPSSRVIPILIPILQLGGGVRYTIDKREGRGVAALDLEAADHAIERSVLRSIARDADIRGLPPRLGLQRTEDGGAWLGGGASKEGEHEEVATDGDAALLDGDHRRFHRTCTGRGYRGDSRFRRYIAVFPHRVLRGCPGRSKHELCDPPFRCRLSVEGGALRDRRGNREEEERERETERQSLSVVAVMVEVVDTDTRIAMAMIMD